MQSPAAICDAFACWPRKRKGLRRGERERERRVCSRNNQRADRTDEWDTTVEDIVRSIDGIGACNVNWLSRVDRERAREKESKRERERVMCDKRDKRVADSAWREKLSRGNKGLRKCAFYERSCYTSFVNDSLRGQKIFGKKYRISSR